MIEEGFGDVPETAVVAGIVNSCEVSLAVEQILCASRVTGFEVPRATPQEVGNGREGLDRERCVRRNGAPKRVPTCDATSTQNFFHALRSDHWEPVAR